MSRTDPAEVLELEYPAEARVVALIRDQVEAFVVPYGISPHDLEDVKMAVSEACGNAVSHGSPGGKRNCVRVRAEVIEGCLRLEIADDGPGFQPKEIRLPNTEEWKPSGRGLFLMVALMDEVRFEGTPTGTHVHLAKYLRQGEASGGKHPGE